MKLIKLRAQDENRICSLIQDQMSKHNQVMGQLWDQLNDRLMDQTWGEASNIINIRLVEFYRQSGNWTSESYTAATILWYAWFVLDPDLWSRSILFQHFCPIWWSFPWPVERVYVAFDSSNYLVWSWWDLNTDSIDENKKWNRFANLKSNYGIRQVVEYVLFKPEKKYSFRLRAFFLTNWKHISWPILKII